jgi:UDP-N-acetylmuramyl pentapeptide phosphotransferase/UDP-N-acetylglucosamine-1-phosphate transferase
MPDFPFKPTDALIFFGLSAFLCIAVIAVLMPLSRRYGWLDAPDARKQHETPTPPVGGFGIFIGIVVPALMLYGYTRESIGFTTGALLLVLVGALDDRFHIDWKIRIAVQTLAALVLIYGAGLRAAHVGPLFGFGDIELGWLSVPFTLFITVALINALNMFDGLDGLAGTVCAAVTAMFVCAAVYSGATDVALGLFWLLGAMAGFLWFNLRRPGQPQARAFLGDAGSGLLGFALAFVIFRLTQNPRHRAPAAPRPFAVRRRPRPRALPDARCRLRRQPDGRADDRADFGQRPVRRAVHARQRAGTADGDGVYRGGVLLVLDHRHAGARHGVFDRPASLPGTGIPLKSRMPGMAVLGRRRYALC